MLEHVVEVTDLAVVSVAAKVVVVLDTVTELQDEMIE
jgi:hypothetical protein